MEDAAGLGCEPRRRMREAREGQGGDGREPTGSSGEGQTRGRERAGSGREGHRGAMEEAEGQQRGMAAAQCAGQ